MQNTIKAILFDLDQTLLDRKTSLKNFLNWQVNFFQLVPQENKGKFIERFISLDRNGTVWKDIVYQKLIDEFNIQHISEDKLLQNYVHDFNKFSVPFQHIEKTILNLWQQGFSLGLVSNGISPFQEHNFYALGLKEYFSCILISDVVRLRKPDPKIFHLCCQELNVSPKQCIFIGDNESADIIGAKNAGMKTIYFNPCAQINSNLADGNFHDYQNLEILIRQLSNNNP